MPHINRSSSDVCMLSGCIYNHSISACSFHWFYSLIPLLLQVCVGVNVCQHEPRGSIKPNYMSNLDYHDLLTYVCRSSFGRWCVCLILWIRLPPTIHYEHKHYQALMISNHTLSNIRLLYVKQYLTYAYCLLISSWGLVVVKWDSYQIGLFFWTSFQSILMVVCVILTVNEGNKIILTVMIGLWSMADRQTGGQPVVSAWLSVCSSVCVQSSLISESYTALWRWRSQPFWRWLAQPARTYGRRPSRIGGRRPSHLLRRQCLLTKNPKRAAGGRLAAQ